MEGRAVLLARCGKVWAVKQHMMHILDTANVAEWTCPRCTWYSGVNLAQALNCQIVAASAQLDTADLLGV